MQKSYKTVPLSQIKPYPNNPRINDAAAKDVAKSIEQCGYIAPIVVDEDMVILAGHTRKLALESLGKTEADIIIVSGLSDAQKRKYRLLDNKTQESADWNFDLLEQELADLDFGDLELDWGIDDDFAESLRNARENGERDEEYEQFEEKFKPKLTTDDCYTPPLVYDAVRDWAVKEYGWQGRKIVRPFRPDGDYQDLTQYPKNSVVIDNPPFSIFSQIRRFYNEHDIDYFLFAPHLTLFSSEERCSFIPIGVQVIYDNGANVNTSFVCSQGARLRTAPELYRAVSAAVQETLKDGKVELPKYQYPVNLITSSKLSQWSRYGIEYSEDRAYFTRQLDAQKGEDKAIFGSGFIVPKAEAEKAEAENRTVWEFSDREKEIIRQLEEQ